MSRSYSVLERPICRLANLVIESRRRRQWRRRTGWRPLIPTANLAQEGYRLGSGGVNSCLHHRGAWRRHPAALQRGGRHRAAKLTAAATAEGPTRHDRPLPSISSNRRASRARDALAEMLRLFGYSVESFPSAFASSARVSVRPTVCIVAHVRMPGMDGIEPGARAGAAAPLRLGGEVYFRPRPGAHGVNRCYQAAVEKVSTP